MFDFDGTLFDSRAAIVHCLHRTCEYFGAPSPTDAMIQASLAGGTNLADAIRRLTGPPPAPAGDTQGTRAHDPDRKHDSDRGFDAGGHDPGWIAVYRDFYAREGGPLSRPFEGAQAALAHTVAQGFAVAVVSNKGEEAIHAALAEYGMADDVALVVGDLPGIPKKPHPAAFEQVVRVRLQVATDAQLTMLGDTPADLQFARNIGAKAYWARYGYGDPATCLGMRPDAVIDSLNDWSAIGAPM